VHDALFFAIVAPWSRTSRSRSQSPTSLYRCSTVAYRVRGKIARGAVVELEVSKGDVSEAAR